MVFSFFCGTTCRWWCKIELRWQLITDRKSYVGFQLEQKSVTWPWRAKVGIPCMSYCAQVDLTLNPITHWLDSNRICYGRNVWLILGLLTYLFLLVLFGSQNENSPVMWSQTVFTFQSPVHLHCVSENRWYWISTITLPNLNRFLKFFHC